MKNKKIIVMIQARTDSTRFPNKILSIIEGKPMLWHVINRIKKMKCDEIVVVTTTRKKDDDVVKIARKSKVKCFRGKTNNVLDRFYQASIKFKAEVIVRITADCPLIDPIQSKKVVNAFLKGNYDYLSNDSKTIPNGLDTECFSFIALKEAWIKSKLKSEKEHVTPYIWKHPKKFRIATIHNKDKKNRENMRWSVDYKNDLEFVKEVYSKLYFKKEIFSMTDILNLIKKEPNLLKINSDHKKNEGYLISLKND
ncbi:cytidylyltransferase domain-containing protein [Nitrosopumilus sp.]|uniref:cytidylyltransferase domain-containing protein n=1 Tax=Nitrosopumilus sp. TaxID=2024843 RepID=UPI003D0EB54B